MSETFNTQTVTPNGSAEAINWPESISRHSEWAIYVSTNSEAVELVDDGSDTEGITVPADETNYPADSWRVKSDGKPTHVYCANNAGSVKLTFVREQ